MQFVVLGYDGKDKGAYARRMAVREEHLENGLRLVKQKKWLYAAGLLNNEGKLFGSMIVCEFSSKEELHSEWLDNEPYVTGNVWEKIEIKKATVPDFFRQTD
jgi:uncharacterized protein